MHTKLKLRDLPSGEALRRYRYKLASMSRTKSKEPTTLTSKFTLDWYDEAKVSSFLDFDASQKLYDVVEGRTKGTLSHFLFAVVLSGFRVFHSGIKAQLFSMRDFFEEAAFAEALEGVVGVKVPDMSVEVVLERLLSEIRGGTTMERAFIEPKIRAKVCPKADKRADLKKVNELIEAIVDQLEADGFENWKAVNEDAQRACASVDKALAQFGTFPSFEKVMATGSSSGEFPTNSTIVFDPQTPFISMDEVQGQAHYAVVSTIAGYSDSVKTLSDKAVAQDSKFKAAQAKDVANDVKLHLTTQTASGLSWLFNKGLELFQTLDVETLCRAYGVPLSERHRIEQVVEAAKAVPAPTYLYHDETPLGYHDFRSSFAGGMDSWVTNYVKRLYELLELVQAMTDPKSQRQLCVPDFTQNGKDFLAETDCHRDEMEALVRRYRELGQKTQTALNNLLGENAQTVAEDLAQIEAFTAVLNRMAAISEQLSNAIIQAEKNTDNLWVTADLVAQLKESGWTKFKRLPKLNQMSGGVPNVSEELAKNATLFETVLAARQAHFEKIQSWANEAGRSIDVLEHLTKKEAQRIRQRPNTKQTARELAIRLVLHRVARVVRDRQDPCAQALKAWFASHHIFKDKTGFNKFFANNQGRLYVSPFNEGRHESFELGFEVDTQADEMFASLCRFIDEYSVVASTYSDEVETLQRLKGFLLGLQIAAIEGTVPHDVAQLTLHQSELGEAVHDSLKLQLEKEEVESSIVAKAFNVYASLLSGALIVLRREQFFLRTKFLWVGKASILYVPKDKPWAIPARYQKSSKWAPLLERDVLVFDEDGMVNPLATFEKVAPGYNKALTAVNKLTKERDALLKNYADYDASQKAKADAQLMAIADELGPQEALIELLHQMPHDWGYELPVKKTKLALKPKKGEVEGHRTVIQLKEGDKPTVKRVDLGTCARLVGPSSFKERLNALLLNKGVGIGGMTLILNQRFTQKHQTVEAKDLRVELAIPIKTPSEEAPEAAMPFKRVVGVDQGEMGIAYAVFDLDEVGNPKATPVAVGTVAIPSIRRLIKGVRTFRKGKQSAQKFNQRFDSTMFGIRENAAGDVCGAIAGLMQRYDALPVLEREVSNLAHGSKQLSLVYKMVNGQFLFSDVDLLNAKRKSWWMGAERWELEGLERVFAQAQDEEDDLMPSLKKAGKTKAEEKKLWVSPGYGVSAYWTSRICSKCGNNVMALIKRLEDEKFKGKITLDEKGETTLAGHTIALQKPRAKYLDQAKTKVDPLWRRAKRRNERPDWVPLANETFSNLKDFKKAVSRSLRRPPKSLMTKDTTQSRYFCPFTSCSHCNVEQHADVNAAINIGRRFLESLSPSKKKAKK